MLVAKKGNLMLAVVVAAEKFYNLMEESVKLGVENRM
jgi:hypothetical protein